LRMHASEEAAVRVVNLGKDADTAGVVLAGVRLQTSYFDDEPVRLALSVDP